MQVSNKIQGKLISWLIKSFKPFMAIFFSENFSSKCMFLMKSKYHIQKKVSYFKIHWRSSHTLNSSFWTFLWGWGGSYTLGVRTLINSHSFDIVNIFSTLREWEVQTSSQQALMIRFQLTMLYCQRFTRGLILIQKICMWMHELVLGDDSMVKRKPS